MSILFTQAIKKVTVMLTAALSCSLLATTAANAYPLDGYDDTGIKRLEFYRMAQIGEVRGRKLQDGQLLSTADIQLALKNAPLSELPPVNNALSEKIRLAIPRSERSRYSVTLLDYTDPNNPQYAAHNPDFQHNVGSVGKFIIGLAVMDQLAKIYPTPALREELLKNTQITASSVILTDSHDVPFFDVERKRLRVRSLRKGDTGNFWEFLDWMFSPSSNAAASVMAEHLVLLSHFREEYPPTNAEFLAFLRETSAKERGAILREALDAPLIANGIDLAKLRQGRPFTWKGRERYPGGVPSKGNTKELLRLMMLMESGLLIDEWSSLTLKRLMYMTERRIRYASHPALNESAVYFKSGSLYSCSSGGCGKYKGDRLNLLASLAIVETPNPPVIIQPPAVMETVTTTDANGNSVQQQVERIPEPVEQLPEKPFELRYAVVVHSNVLRKNSAVAHQTLAMRIHRILEKEHQQ